MPGRLFSILVAVAGLILAACSMNSPPSRPFVPSGAQPAVVATPLDYLYVLNYNGSDIAQWIFNPKTKPVLKPLAPNFTLPSGCANPDSLAVIPQEHRIFVACFSGEVIALTIGQNHALEKSKIHPVAVPSPLYVIAPHTGVAGQLYVSEYPGAVAQLKFTPKSLKLLNTYPTGSLYPNELAFYTNSAKVSRLFVAAPYDSSAPCGSSTGAILVFQQAAGGTLQQQTSIPTCGGAYNVVAANDAVYWAGPSVLGGYSLKNNALLPSPSPPWPAGQGPPYYANAMSAIRVQRTPKSPDFDPNDTGGTDFQVAANNGTLTIFDGNLKPLVTWHGITSQPSPGSHCQDYSTGITVGGKLYRTVCWQLINDEIVVYGLTKPYGRVVDFGKFSTGDFPIAMWSSLPCDYVTYYLYGC